MGSKSCVVIPPSNHMQERSRAELAVMDNDSLKTHLGLFGSSVDIILLPRSELRSGSVYDDYSLRFRLQVIRIKFIVMTSQFVDLHSIIVFWFLRGERNSLSFTSLEG